ncbi:MAG: ATP-binding protein [Myxococcota bacterium]
MPNLLSLPAGIDHLLPPAVRAAGPVRLRQARLVVCFSLVLSLMSAVFLPVCLALGQPTVAMACGCAALIDLLPIGILWVSRSPVLAGTVSGILWSLAMVGFASVLGGVHGTVLFWSAPILVAVLLQSGRQGAFPILILHVLIVAFFAVSERSGVSFAHLERPFDAAGQGVTIAVLAIGVFGLCSLFVVANERMQAALEERNAELHHVLDNVGQGFFCADPEGRLVGQRSTAMDRWFGRPAPGAAVWAYLGVDDRAFATSAELGWSALVEDVLPLELCLDQLPRGLSRNGRLYRVEYRPVLREERVERLIVVVTDITELTETERAEADQREFAAALDHAFTDRSGFDQFLAEVGRLLGELEAKPAQVTAMRLLHTIKGNCAMFGALRIMALAQALEGRLADEGEPPSDAALAELRALWDAYAARIVSVIGDHADSFVLDRSRHAALLAATRARLPYEELDRMVTSLPLEPVAVPLRRAGAHALALARFLKKPAPEVQVSDGGLLLDPRQWGGFWAAFVHVVRNAVDHGLESPERRVALGKSSSGLLRLTAERSDTGIVMQIADNGQGVDWAKVQQRAEALHLPHHTPAETAEALFADGLSTRAEPTTVSGRGVGMGAFREAARGLGGAVEVRSERDVGTQVRITFPAPLHVGVA